MGTASDRKEPEDRKVLEALRAGLAAAEAAVRDGAAALRNECTRLGRTNAALERREAARAAAAAAAADGTGLGGEMAAADRAGLSLVQLLAVVRIQAHMRRFLTFRATQKVLARGREVEAAYQSVLGGCQSMAETTR
jgi:hypothetical protein